MPAIFFLIPFGEYVISVSMHSKGGKLTAGKSSDAFLSVEVKEDRIISVINREKAPKQAKGIHVIDYGNAVIMPGLVDVHVHLNEPGRVEWEGFVTGTKAAAAVEAQHLKEVCDEQALYFSTLLSSHPSGGFTTLIDMPLNSAPTTISKEAFDMKVEAAKGKIFVDVGFWGGLVPENAFNSSALNELLGAGALGLKVVSRLESNKLMCE
eukprot:Gb_06435 [translate_table: standard]